MTTANIALLIDPQNGFGLKEDIPLDEGGSLHVEDGASIGKPIARFLGHIGQSNDDWSVIASQDWHPKGHISFASSHNGVTPFTHVHIQAANDIVRVAGVVDGDKIWDVDNDYRGHILQVLRDKQLERIPVNSFEQVLWTDHCVIGSRSASFLAPVMNALPPTLRADLQNSRLNGRHLLRSSDRQGHPIIVIRKGYDKRYDSHSLVKDNGSITETAAREYFEELGKELCARGVKKVRVFFCGLATEICVYLSFNDTHAILPGILAKNGVEEVQFFFLPEASRGITPAGTRAALERMAAQGVQQTTVDNIKASASGRPLVASPLFAPGG